MPSVRGISSGLLEGFYGLCIAEFTSFPIPVTSMLTTFPVAKLELTFID